MSWITGLADKAENILNKIDQNAATALQLPAGSELSLEAMRKGLSSSTQSLKSSISPNRRSGGGGSVKSENAAMTEPIDLEKGKLEWHIGPPSTEMTTSRRSSLSGSSKADAIAIDMGAEVTNGVESIAPMQLSLTNSSTPLLTSADAQELAAFRIALSQVTSERDELRLRLSALNRDVENAALKQRAQELEMLTQRLTEERDRAQSELSDLQTANSAYVHSISELETNLAKTQQEYFELAQKLQMQMKETEQQRLELQEYRTKAQRALQMKDALIAELKNSAGGNSTNSAVEESDARLLQIEFDALKQEYQQALTECDSLRTHSDELRLEWQATRNQYEQQLAAARSSEESSRKELRLERERLLATESEQRVLTQELAKLRQQLSNQMATAATRLQEKEQQLQRSRSERGSNNSEFIDDYDARLRTLTQTLVDKQNAVEKITAERNALRIQLEKVQDQLQQTIYSYSISSKNTRSANAGFSLANGAITDDAKAQIPFLLRDNPFDNRVSRNMKRFYSCFDSAGIRLMRSMRYPLWRTFVLMYIVVLHIWVMFVLLSSTPN